MLKEGLRRSYAHLLGSWYKIPTTCYLLALDSLKPRGTWYLIALEGQITCGLPIYTGEELRNGVNGFLTSYATDSVRFLQQILDI